MPLFKYSQIRIGQSYGVKSKARTVIGIHGSIYTHIGLATEGDPCLGSDNIVVWRGKYKNPLRIHRCLASSFAQWYRNHLRKRRSTVANQSKEEK